MSVPAQGPPPASVPITTLLSPPANGLSGGLSLCALQCDRDWILQNEGAAQRVLVGDAALDGVFTVLGVGWRSPCLFLSLFTVPLNL